MSFKQDMLKLPNLVSSIRILIAPLMFVFAFRQMEAWFLGALIFSGLTDVLDGFLARKLDLITPLGAHLDSWGDFTIFGTMAICAWILWPEITQRELLLLCTDPVQLPVARAGRPGQVRQTDRLSHLER